MADRTVKDILLSEGEFSPKTEEYLKKLDEEWIKKALNAKKKPKPDRYAQNKKILSELYDAKMYERRHANQVTESESYNLLEVDDWSKITLKELKQRINNGDIVNWIDGYDVGPSPLTEALQQGASSKIIGLLVANGADIDTPTVLPSGTKVTPLEIIRMQPATHDNLQKELILLRAGAKDDAMVLLKENKADKSIEWMFKRGQTLRKQLIYLGLHKGEKVFQCGCSYIYVKEHAGKIWFDDDFELYDRLTPFSPYDDNVPDWLTNELGPKLAKKFFLECGKLSANEAMYKYYIYLARVYKEDKAKLIRINTAAEDFRKRFLHKH